MDGSVNANVRHLGVTRNAYEDKAGIWKPGTGLDYKNTITDIVNIFMKRLLGSQGNTQITIGDQLTLDADLDLNDNTNAEDYKAVDAALKKAFKDINEAKKFREFLSKILNGTLTLPQTFKTISGVNITISAGPAEAPKATAPVTVDQNSGTSASKPPVVVAVPAGLQLDSSKLTPMERVFMKPGVNVEKIKAVIAEALKDGKMTYNEVKDYISPELFGIICSGMVEGVTHDDVIDAQDIAVFDKRAVEYAMALFGFPRTPAELDVYINNAVALYKDAVVFTNANLDAVWASAELIRGGAVTGGKPITGATTIDELVAGVNPLFQQLVLLRFADLTGKDGKNIKQKDVLFNVDLTGKTPVQLQSIKAEEDFVVTEMCRFLASLALISKMGDKQKNYWAMVYPNATPQNLEAMTIRYIYGESIEYTPQNNITYLRRSEQPAASQADARTSTEQTQGGASGGAGGATGAEAGKSAATGGTGGATGAEAGKSAATTGPKKPVKPAPADLLVATAPSPADIMSLVMSSDPGERSSLTAKIIEAIKGTRDPKAAKALVIQHVKTTYTDAKCASFATITPDAKSSRDELLAALEKAA